MGTHPTYTQPPHASVRQFHIAPRHTYNVQYMHTYVRAHTHTCSVWWWLYTVAVSLVLCVCVRVHSMTPQLLINSYFFI